MARARKKRYLLARVQVIRPFSHAIILKGRANKLYPQRSKGRRSLGAERRKSWLKLSL